MKLTVDCKTMEKGLSVIQMKGMYRHANVAKTSSIGDIGVLIVREDNLFMLNASNTIAAQVTVPIVEKEPGEKMVMFNIQKTMKYLKSLVSDEVELELGDSMLKFIGGSATAEMPASIEHPALQFITKLNTMDISHEQLPSFNNTQLEAQLVVDGKELSDAIKGCSTIGNATYELKYIQNEEGGKATLSSGNYPNLDSYTVNLTLLAHMGKETTVQFSAPMDKFCDGVMWIYIKNKSPILFVGADRRLVMAPYIQR